MAAIEVTTPGGRDIIYAGDETQSLRYSDDFNASCRVLVVRLDDWGKPVTASALDVEEFNAGSYSYSAEGKARSVFFNKYSAHPLGTFFGVRPDENQVNISFLGRCDEEL